MKEVETSLLEIKVLDDGALRARQRLGLPAVERAHVQLLCPGFSVDRDVDERPAVG